MSWQVKKLGELCKIELGKTPARSNKKLWDDSKETKNIWLSIADLPSSIKPRVGDSKEYISDEGASLCKLVPEGTLIVSFKLSLGRLAYTACDLYTNEAIAALYIVDNEVICQDYLYWFLTYFDWDKAAGNDVKVKGKTLNKAKLKEILIPVPSIDEQKQIVDSLDKIFIGIQKTVSTAAKNLCNAKEIFDSYLWGKFSHHRNGWELTHLGEEIDLLTGFAFKSKEYVSGGNDIPLIRGDNITQGELRWNGVKRWPISRREEFAKYELSENDLVLAMDRTWIKAGIKFARISPNDLPALLVQRVARLRCLDSLYHGFLYHLIGSKYFENYVLSIQTGLGVPHISGKQIESFTFFKPCFTEQVELAKKADDLKCQVQLLQGIYQKKLDLLSELKSSVLKEAFSGTGELMKSKGAAA